jgi:U3 small nucleolar RNA-associated protein 4
MTAHIPSLSQQQQQHQTTSSLHRIRFIDQTPSPITTISFAPIPLPPPSQSIGKGKGKADQENGKDELGVLVVGRENGELEIWNWGREDEGGSGNWVLQKVDPSHEMTRY